MRRLAESRGVHLYLIRPSNYDDEGYVVRYLRGVLPSNSLACLAALTDEAQADDRFRDLDIRVHVIDETVMRVDCKKICKSQKDGFKTVVCLVGVQSNQFPRAADLARIFAAAGLTVLIGGFHVSGHLALLEGVPPDIQELLDLGVCVVKGEVEGRWTGLLVDAVEGRLQPLYDFLEDKPDLGEAPVPRIDRRCLKHFASRRFGTIDCGRGCPYNCSFCTIINVQGRKMRFRSPQAIRVAIRENYRRHGIDFYFFTDDNFARNKNWEAILDVLIDLREKEGIPVEFMMQVDALSHRIPNFVEKASRAGCSQVFIGMESINPRNLKRVGKRQNKVGDYQNLIETYRRAQIITHAGYILGLDFDTPESVEEDLRQLQEEVKVDIASFFILTPLPGSFDYVKMREEGRVLDPDFNRYDSFHETMAFANFPEPGSLLESYRKAWESFYRFENMRGVLLRASKRTYWNIFRNFLWYKSSISIEGRHPMMSGLFRLKSRRGVRPGSPVLSRRKFLKKRLGETWHFFREGFKLLLEMELLWLETREQSDIERKLLEELNALRRDARASVRLKELQAAYRRAKKHLPALQVPSRLSLFLEKWSPFTLRGSFYFSHEVMNFWSDCLENARRGKFFRIPVLPMLTRSWLESKLTLHFLLAWMQRETPDYA